MSARERILARVREALNGRARAQHPGAFGGWRPEPLADDAAVGFAAAFAAAGGEVVRVQDDAAAVAWLEAFGAPLAGAAVGSTVPATLRPHLPPAPPEAAGLGVSMAAGAAAETGSLLLDARDGRRCQILPPTHVVLVRAAAVHRALADALEAARADLPSALALHSGPSKSADIGQIVVTGVHGPGRVVAVVIGG